MGYAPPQDGDEEGQIRKTLYLDCFKGAVQFFTYKRTAEPNLLILVAFFVTLRLGGCPQG